MSISMAPLHSDSSVTLGVDGDYIPLPGVKENISSGLSKRSWAGIGVLLIGAVGLVVAYAQGYGPFSNTNAAPAPALKQSEVDDWIRYGNELGDDLIASAQHEDGEFYQVGFMPIDDLIGDSEQFRGDRSDFRAEMLNNLNSVRRSAGRPPVVLNSRLNAAAQAHSDDMARNRFMDHTGSDGSSMTDRIRRAGISRPGAHAENVAAGQTSVSRVMTDWVNSPGHYRNIIGSYTDVGFGLARGSDGVRRWTQKFASNPR
jgi:uncharacterized protein YkwD